jgi:hypothetical protein
MPSSLQGNPLAFLRGAGGSVSPAGPTAIGGAPPGPGGAGPMPGGEPGGMPGGEITPEMIEMAAAQKILPQVFAQQNSEYYKKFLKNMAKMLREFMRIRGLGPRVVSTVGRSVTSLDSAMNMIDKERPEESGPVESLLAQGMMENKSAMGSPLPMQSLPITR